MAKNTNKTRTNTKENVKPSFDEWYNSLSKPAKSAFKIGVRYALKCVRDEQQLKRVLAL